MTRQLKLIDILILAVAGFAAPLDLLAENVVGIPHPERLILVGLAATCVGLLVAWLLVRLGSTRSGAVFPSFLLVLGLTMGAPLAQRLGFAVAAIGIVVSVVTVALLARQASERLVRSALVALSVFVVLGPVFGAIGSLQRFGESTVSFDSPLEEVSLSETPDIFLVVVDGYGGELSMANDLGIARPNLRVGLENEGFQLVRSGWTSYSLTSAAIPSILNSNLPLSDGDVPNLATQGDLYRAIAGRSGLINALAGSGYVPTMVESGWSGSSCGPEFAVCVASPFFDEAMARLAARSLFGRPILDRFHPFTIGAGNAMDWLLQNAGQISSNEQADFLFVHLLAPHPPFYLDASCQSDYRPEGAGLTFWNPAVSLGTRIEAYERQVDCVDSVVARLGDVVAEGTLIVVISDHGTDSRGQLAKPPDDWTEDDVAERFNVLIAMRSSACSLTDPVFAPDVFRQVLSCLSDQGLSEVEKRMLIYPGLGFDQPYPVVEANSELVRRLSEGSPAPAEADRQ